MKIRTMLAIPFYSIWLIVYNIGLILAAIAAMVDGNTDIISRAYGKERS